MRSIVRFVLCAPLALAGCGKSEELTIERALVRLSANPRAPSAAYFTVKGGPVDERLIDVSSPVVIRAEMHESMKDGAMATMKPITGGVAVPAHSTVQFEEGGRHVMLFSVNSGITPGKTMALVFTFASGNKFQIQAKVRRPGEIL